MSVNEILEDKYNYYIATEILEGGELFDRIVKKSVYNEKEARDVCTILLAVMKHLHERNIVHR